MKLYRVVSYVLELNQEYKSKDDLIHTIEFNKHPQFHHVEEVEFVEIEDFHDDHPLNKKGCDYEEYFYDCKLRNKK